MDHFANFEVFGKLVQKDAMRPAQGNNPTGNNINFLIEKTTTWNNKTSVKVVPLYAVGHVATGIDRTEIGTELFIKGTVGGNQSKQGDRYYPSLMVNSVAKVQPKPSGQPWGNQNGGGNYQKSSNTNWQNNQGYQNGQGYQGSQGYQNGQGYQSNQGYQGGYGNKSNQQSRQDSQPPAQQQYDGGDDMF